MYCLRARDGKLAWRFRAAPVDRRTVARNQVESLWPVHGSVLVQGGVAYAAAGRSSYLDGGIRMFALDPGTGDVLAETRLDDDSPGPTEVPEGSPRENIDQNAIDIKTAAASDRSDAFSMSGGATNDVLVGDGDSVHLRHLRFDSQLASMQARGRHLFSTSSLLDDNQNHRSHCMLGVADFSRVPVAYSWIANAPNGRQGIHVAVPYGMLLAFDAQTAWGVRRTGGFGYQLFSEPVPPFDAAQATQSDIRAKPEDAGERWSWSREMLIRPRALVRAGERLLIGGMPVAKVSGGLPAWEGREGGALLSVAADDGDILGQLPLESPPVWDGIAVADGHLYISTMAGTLVCLTSGGSRTP